MGSEDTGRHEQNTDGVNKLTTPGVEPGLSRPRRDVLTTRRCSPCRCVAFCLSPCTSPVSLLREWLAKESVVRYDLINDWVDDAQCVGCTAKWRSFNDCCSHQHACVGHRLLHDGRSHARFALRRRPAGSCRRGFGRLTLARGSHNTTP